MNLKASKLKKNGKDKSFKKAYMIQTSGHDTSKLKICMKGWNDSSNVSVMAT
jgi:hypothetical protein